MTSRRQFMYSCGGLVLTVSQGTLATFSEQATATVSVVDPSIAKLDAIGVLMQAFLQKSYVTAAQLAICRDGVLIYNRAYGTKPPHGFAPVDTRSLFRIASCSKLFTCAAVETLRARGKLDMELKVFPFLKIVTPARSKDKHDPLIDGITVRQLVDHAGGWNDHETVQAKDGTRIPGTNWDPVFKLREIAIDMGISAAPTKLELARYMYGKPLQFVPGTQDFHSTAEKSYSNLGYVLLGLVVEAVSGQPFINFVQNGLVGGAPTMNVFTSRLQGKDRDPREVWYTDPGKGPTILNLYSQALLPAPYGGGGFLPETMDSAGGLMTNAETLALSISRFAVWGLGGRAPGSTRTGSIPGTSSLATSRRNGVDCAFILNTRTFQDGARQLDAFSNALQNQLDEL